MKKTLIHSLTFPPDTVSTGMIVSEIADGINSEHHNIEVLASSIKEILDVPDHPTDVIGTRHGEKIFEVLLSREEMANATDLGEFYRVAPDLRDLNYEKYFDEGKTKISLSEEYNSHNTFRLDIEGMKELLMKLPYMKDIMHLDTLDVDN